jgi:hypothetical protein
MRSAFVTIAVLAFFGLVGETRGADVELEVILTSDVSRSVDDAEFDLQRKGYAAALTDPPVLAAIQGRFDKADADRRPRTRQRARDRKFADSPLEEAVSSEPVSETKFPASWENTGNFVRRGLRLPLLAWNLGPNTMAYDPIPYATEQGIYFGLAGN